MGNWFNRDWFKIGSWEYLYDKDHKMPKAWEWRYTDSLIKIKEVLQNYDLDKVALSFSGGKDSTLLLTMIEDLGLKNKIKVFFANTFMEYEAQLSFINDLRNQGWIIHESKPRIPQPLIYLKFGKPINSKMTSEMLHRLQKHNFDFVNETFEPYEVLLKKYPNCISALKWLTGHERVTIKCPNWLKKQLKDITFKVSNKCCYYLKKLPAKDFNKEHKIELSIQGIRHAEGGVRTLAYKGCFFKGKPDKLFPIIHYTDEDVWEIIKEKNIKLSDTYTKYGLLRTGCVGCPFGKDFNEELEICEKYEPNKAVAIKKLYSDVYEIQNNRGKKND